MTRGAGVARSKGHIVGKDQTRNNVARGALRGRMFGRRLQVDAEGNTGVKDRRTKRRLHLGNERLASQIFGKAFKLEMAKRIADLLSGYERSRIGHSGGVDPSETKNKQETEKEPVL
jgi:hypothetical protein